MKPTPDIGYIYAIQAEHVHLIKLGFSAEPSARLHDLKTGSPVRLTLLALWRGTVADEQALHREFHAHHEHGEWFKPAPPIISRLLAKNEASPAHLADLNGQRRRVAQPGAAQTDPPKSNGGRFRNASKLAAPSGFDLRHRKNGSVRIYKCDADGKKLPVGTLPAEEVQRLLKLPLEAQQARVLALAEEREQQAGNGGND